jgi:ketosteroid isomerase-like protein
MMFPNHRVIVAWALAGLALAPAKLFGQNNNAMLSTGPTAENALAADQELARALQNNDTAGIYRMLDKDWAVIPSFGAVLEGPDVFPSGIRSGYRTLTVMELSEPRVRVYADIATVTTKVRLSGQLGGKAYNDLTMRQTDVLRWEQGGWKCVLTQEAVVKE